MGKLNKKPNVSDKVLSHPDLTVNREGGVAFKPDAKLKLMLKTLSSMIGEKGFYASGNELDTELRQSIHEVATEDPGFILKLALYARTQMHLRTAPMVLLGEYSMSVGKGKVQNARKYVSATIQRADEITELVSYVLTQNTTRKAFKGKLPQVIKFGVADAFTKFDEYQFGKYNRDGAVKFKDAMALCHPTPKDKEQEAVFKAIIEDKLKTPYTWETQLSTRGNTKEVWDELIASGKVGYMAMLRNLRNMLDKKVDMTPVCKRIADKTQVQKSKQFPYRFVSAYKELEGREDSGKVLEALSDAVEMSVGNVPEFTGKTFVTCDISGSMRIPPSNKSKIRMNEIGCLFGAIMHKKSADSVVSVFATDHVPLSLNSRDSMFTNLNKMVRTDTHGFGTDAYKVMNWLVSNKVFVDRIVLFSDMQCYSGDAKSQYRLNATDNIYAGLLKYKQQVNPNVFVYSFNLAGYGEMQFPQSEPRVCMISGWSDKVLNFIPMFERSRADMMAEIEAVSV